MCSDCPKRGICKKICDEVETVLETLNHSLKSNYLVKFVDPHRLEESAIESDTEARYPSEQRWEEYRRLDRKVGRLTKTQRICVCYYYGLRGESSISEPKIAKILHVSTNTVSYHLVRARRLLKLRMID
jgi:DNA-directed RNA polymerase specialized sigma24 family protein